jgi:hypothetical protein
MGKDQSSERAQEWHLQLDHQKALLPLKKGREGGISGKAFSIRESIAQNLSGKSH